MPTIGRSAGLAAAFLSTLLAAGCAGAAGSGPADPAPDAGPPPPPPVHETTRATLWVRTSAEYRALALQTYAAASEAMREALADRSITAALEQEGRTYRSLPPAVIVDVDETVLDNSPFQARMILRGTDYEPGAWAEWTASSSAEPVPGALEFAREAERLGVRIFYVTNRTAAEEPATTRNLERVGFPLAAGEDVVLTRGEREEWGSDKTTRRSHVAARYHVLLILGDDLNDFTSGVRTGLEERDRVADRLEERWGSRWFLLPNPIYGSWEGALYSGRSATSAEERRRIQAEWLREPPGGR